MPQKITNRYSRINPQTSSGTCRNMRMLSRQRNAEIFNNKVNPATSAKDAQILSFSPFSSFCPNRMEKTAPLPIQSPSKIEVKNVISVKDEPTAANAWLPKNFPTIRVSAML